jgi:hypothetical protein
MEKDGAKAPDGKDNAVLKKYFEKVYPDLDFERVYSSDLKKMVKWFEVLKANEIEIKLSQASEEPTADESETEVVAEEVETQSEPAKDEKKAPAKKKAASKPKPKADVREAKEPKEAKPKKAAPKKKKEDK